MNWRQNFSNIVIAGNELWRIAMLFVSMLTGLPAGRVVQATRLRSAGLLESRGRELAGVALTASAASRSRSPRRTS